MGYYRHIGVFLGGGGEGWKDGVEVTRGMADMIT